MVIKEKVFVVTGAGGGIGGELVKILLSKGAKVAAVDLKPESLEALKSSTTKNQEDLSIHACDISDKKAVFALPNAIAKKHGKVDALINCAGIIQPFVKVSDLEFDAIERVFNVNLYGTIYMTKAFLPGLLKRPEAYIVNYSSMGGFLPVPGQSVYGASKAAVKLLTEGLYAELLNTNVHVSVVFPGATQTDIAKNSGIKISGMDADSSKYTSLPASKSAELVVKGIEKNKPRIFTGSDSKSMNVLYRLAPTFAVKMITKKCRRFLNSRLQLIEDVSPWYTPNIKQEVCMKNSPSGALVPAGLLIGMGVGFLTNQLVAGLFIGLGSGILLMIVFEVINKSNKEK